MQTVEEFANLTQEEMLRWLSTAADEHFDEAKGINAFKPFDRYFTPRTESAPEALANGLHSLPSRAQNTFKSAIEQFVQGIPAGQTDVWSFICELIFRLDAGNAIHAIERRLTPHFITAMEAAAPAGFRVATHLLNLLRNVSPAHTEESRPLTTLVRRLIQSDAVNDAQARVTVLRLCEIDPDEWFEHLACCRALLHQQMNRILSTRSAEALQTMQDELAEDIVAAIGFDRLARDLGKLRLTKDLRPEDPSEDWLFEATFVRRGLVVMTKDGRIAPANNETYLRTIASASLYDGPTSAGGPDWDAEDYDFEEPPPPPDADQVAFALGEAA